MASFISLAALLALSPLSRGVQRNPQNWARNALFAFGL